MSSDELKALIKETLIEHNNNQPIDKEERHINQKEASEFLQISQTAIIEWKKRGLIPYHQIPNTRKIYYLKSELIEASTDIDKTWNTRALSIVLNIISGPGGRI